MGLFTKATLPVLEPQPHLEWASGAVFNPGVWYDGATVHLLFRAVPAGYERVPLDNPGPTEPTMGFDDYVSYIGYAHSADGIHFTCRDEPFIRPDTEADRFGAEDPRITWLDDRYLITYTALSQPAFGAEDGVRVGLASTPDFQTLHKHGIVGPPVRDKDAVIFPRRIGGRIAMLHRIVPDIQLIYFDSLEQLVHPPERLWQEHLATLDEHVVMRAAQAWEAKKIGAGPPPIETEEGWLLIYHGVDLNHVYCAGLALLDPDDPTRVIARTARPVLEPELDFELKGDVNNVVFPEGVAVIDGMLHVYYGGADRVIGHARAPLVEVLDLLREEEHRQQHLPRVHLVRDGYDDVGRTIERVPPVQPERLHGGRPVLEPLPEHAWESKVVLNPAAVLVEGGSELERLGKEWALTRTQCARLQVAGGACVLLYRAQGAVDPQTGHAVSSIGLAVCTPELVLVERWPEPVLRPDAPFHNLGVEDARCTRVGDTYYLYYTGYTSASGNGTLGGRVQICLATTQDFLNWELHGPLPGDLNAVDNKNAALFPEPVNGQWLLLHRPMQGRHPMAIHLAVADRPEGPFQSRGLLMASYRYREFARSWIGAGGPPLALGDNRFLMIYHQGHFDWQHAREYDLAAALLDFNEEEPVRRRIEPLMRPQGALEQQGDRELGVDNVLFACANYRWQRDLIIPYAAADSRIFGARLPFEALVTALEEASAPVT